jgi:hypothetical protein
MALPKVYAPASTALRFFRVGKPPLHDKAVFFEEDVIDLGLIIGNGLRFFMCYLAVCTLRRSHTVLTVGITARLRAEQQEYSSRQGQKILLDSVHTDSEAHTASYLMGTEGPNPGVKAKWA